MFKQPNLTSADILDQEEYKRVMTLIANANDYVRRFQSGTIGSKQNTSAEDQERKILLALQSPDRMLSAERDWQAFTAVQLNQATSASQKPTTIVETETTKEKDTKTSLPPNGDKSSSAGVSSTAIIAAQQQPPIPQPVAGESAISDTARTKYPLTFSGTKANRATFDLFLHSAKGQYNKGYLTEKFIEVLFFVKRYSESDWQDELSKIRYIAQNSIAISIDTNAIPHNPNLSAFSHNIVSLLETTVQLRNSPVGRLLASVAYLINLHASIDTALEQRLLDLTLIEYILCHLPAIIDHNMAAQTLYRLLGPLPSTINRGYDNAAALTSKVEIVKNARAEIKDKLDRQPFVEKLNSLSRKIAGLAEYLEQFVINVFRRNAEEYYLKTLVNADQQIWNKDDFKAAVRKQCELLNSILDAVSKKEAGFYTYIFGGKNTVAYQKIDLAKFWAYFSEKTFIHKHLETMTLEVFFEKIKKLPSHHPSNTYLDIYSEIFVETKISIQSFVSICDPITQLLFNDRPIFSAALSGISPVTENHAGSAATASSTPLNHQTLSTMNIAIGNELSTALKNSEGMIALHAIIDPLQIIKDNSNAAGSNYIFDFADQNLRMFERVQNDKKTDEIPDPEFGIMYILGKALQAIPCITLAKKQIELLANNSNNLGYIISLLYQGDFHENTTGLLTDIKAHLSVLREYTPLVAKYYVFLKNNHSRVEQTILQQYERISSYDRYITNIITDLESMEAILLYINAFITDYKNNYQKFINDAIVNFGVSQTTGILVKAFRIALRTKNESGAPITVNIRPDIQRASQVLAHFCQTIQKITGHAYDPTKTIAKQAIDETEQKKRQEVLAWSQQLADDKVTVHEWQAAITKLGIIDRFKFITELEGGESAEIQFGQKVVETLQVKLTNTNLNKLLKLVKSIPLQELINIELAKESDAVSIAITMIYIWQNKTHTKNLVRTMPDAELQQHLFLLTRVKSYCLAEYLSTSFEKKKLTKSQSKRYRNISKLIQDEHSILTQDKSIILQQIKSLLCVYGMELHDFLGSLTESQKNIVSADDMNEVEKYEHKECITLGHLICPDIIHCIAKLYQVSPGQLLIILLSEKSALQKTDLLTTLLSCDSSVATRLLHIYDKTDISLSHLYAYVYDVDYHVLFAHPAFSLYYEISESKKAEFCQFLKIPFEHFDMLTLTIKYEKRILLYQIAALVGRKVEEFEKDFPAVEPQVQTIKGKQLMPMSVNAEQTAAITINSPVRTTFNDRQDAVLANIFYGETSLPLPFTQRVPARNTDQVTISAGAGSNDAVASESSPLKLMIVKGPVFMNDHNRDSSVSSRTTTTVNSNSISSSSNVNVVVKKI